MAAKSKLNMMKNTFIPSLSKSSRNSLLTGPIGALPLPDLKRNSAESYALLREPKKNLHTTFCQELLTKYQEIVNTYLEKSSIGNPDKIDKFYWKSDFLLEEDWTRLYAIYVQMTESQQKEQLISFWGPSPVLNRAFPPNQRSYDLWIEDQKCYIWIDGEKVDNSTLNSHKPTDFVYRFTSSLRRSGGKIDEYRVDLWTETGHKKFSEQFFEQPVSIDQLLEIEPKIFFLVEKDDNKPITLYLDPEHRNGWWMNRVTKISGDTVFSTGGPNVSPPSTYHPKSNFP